MYDSPMLTKCRAWLMRLLPILMIAISSALGACNGEGDLPPQQAGPARTSDWRTVNGNPAVAVPQGEDDRELQEAMRQAQATADQARERWLSETPELQQRWSIKWAAPRAEGGVEHVWVQPQHWSAFRIEGVL